MTSRLTSFCVPAPPAAATTSTSTPARQLHRRAHVRVRRVLDLMPVVVRDRASESTEPLGNCAADPAQSDDPDAGVAHLARQRVVPVDRPPARPHVAVRRRELAQRVDHQARPPCPPRSRSARRGCCSRRPRARPPRRRRSCRSRRRSSPPRRGSAARPSTPRPRPCGPRSPPRGSPRRARRGTRAGLIGQYVGRVVVLQRLRQRRLQRADLQYGSSLRMVLIVLPTLRRPADTRPTFNSHGLISKAASLARLPAVAGYRCVAAIA